MQFMHAICMRVLCFFSYGFYAYGMHRHFPHLRFPPLCLTGLGPHDFVGTAMYINIKMCIRNALKTFNERNALKKKQYLKIGS